MALLFGGAISVGAFLLFWIQPMFGKMVLPKLGGAPNVWITAMLFFQTMLLVGYGYAHLTTRYMSIGGQVIVHILVLAAGLGVLPVAVSSIAPFEGWPIAWVIAIMFVSIGLPFFAVSGTSPLLQRWFACSGHPAASDPYFLYAGSNVGSIAALLCFPILLEPYLGLDDQRWVWTAGYGALITLIVFCGIGLVRNGTGGHVAHEPAHRADFAPVDTAQRLWWVVLAFAPSSLMLGVTTRITTDLAAAPLLWVIPLTLYLLSYVLTFARHQPLRHRWMVKIQPYVMALGLISVAHTGLWPLLFVDILVFFICAMVCHGELIRRRPEAAQLTEFYLWIAFGGMLGGVFNAIVAPQLFNGPYEYAISLVVVAFLRPGGTGGHVHARARDLLLPVKFFAVMALVWLIFDFYLTNYSWIGFYLFFVGTGIYLIAFKERPIRFGLAIAAALLITAVIGPNADIQDRSRSFFGIYKLERLENGKINALKHGNTLHGAQFVDKKHWREPLTYYSKNGPVGQFFDILEARRPMQRVGLLGLGVGTMLCYGRPGQHWTVFEIDPLVERIARDTRYFRYLSECLPSSAVSVVHGDGRLSLEDRRNDRFDLLILDAFNSDAIPVHLLTREAFAIYRERIADNGIILLNFSNRYLDLRTVLSRLVDDAGLHALYQDYAPVRGSDVEDAASFWMVMAKRQSDLKIFAKDDRWTRLPSGDGQGLWTDDFSNILDVMYWQIHFHKLSFAWRSAK